jgi:hypothetical protein
MQAFVEQEQQRMMFQQWIRCDVCPINKALSNLCWECMQLLDVLCDLLLRTRDWRAQTMYNRDRFHLASSRQSGDPKADCEGR